MKDFMKKLALGIALAGCVGAAQAEATHYVKFIAILDDGARIPLNITIDANAEVSDSCRLFIQDDSGRNDQEIETKFCSHNVERSPVVEPPPSKKPVVKPPPKKEPVLIGVDSTYLDSLGGFSTLYRDDGSIANHVRLTMKYVVKGSNSSCKILSWSWKRSSSKYIRIEGATVNCPAGARMDYQLWTN